MDEFEDGFFDVITIFHLAHMVADPRGMVHRCAAKLKPGGTIILELPNILQGYTMEVKNLRRRLLGHPPAHPWGKPILYYFNIASFQRLVTDTGFSVCGLETFNPAELCIEASISKLFAISSPPLFLQKILHWGILRRSFPYLDRLCHLTDTGEFMAVAGAKPSAAFETSSP